MDDSIELSWVYQEEDTNEIGNLVNEAVANRDVMGLQI